ncbi:redoxin domain-containing protein [Rhodalgimonas zhirmunskyi]|uniref:Alkyl hydroperoxide reductase C n=1 Tax=Rhodalgimonas zhirmunskyi TaxID=2964767 RepID=A0AAJ1X4F2_9RHOB|nr:redoxin domain-containing protein [Rhodoalgimonas zhirmunskyi]MDQ2093441.1 redoxin domain-containing protein [Rhodoalgimonas zhirmunskyi]
MGFMDDTGRFGPSGVESLFMDAGRKRKLPQVGDRFANFVAETTHGRLSLENYADGHWVYLFSFPSTFAPVCSTEIVSLAAQIKAFNDLGVRLMGVTCSDVNRALDWIEDLEEVFNVRVPFPVVCDPQGELVRELGMINPSESARTAMRKSIILDPSRKVQLMMDYPAYLGRCADEVLRCLEGLQDIDYTGMALPADWMPGDYMVAPGPMSDADMCSSFGDNWHKVRDYLVVARG